jgi:hypothetical protein
LGNGAAQENEHYFITVNTLTARPIGMGGAFTAIDDDLAALLYNPANFSLYQDQRTKRLTLFFNPIAPIVALHAPEELFGRSRITWEEALAAVGLFIKGMTLSLAPFEFGALFGEQAPDTEMLPQHRVFDAQEYIDNQYNIFGVRMHIAERVSLGGSIGLYYSRQKQQGREWGIGASYGVQVRPARQVLVGVSYINVPDKLPKYREEIERIVDGGVNLGISFHSKFGTTISADIRNLGEEKASSGELIREAHIGLEQILFSHFALRTGVFRKRHERSEDRYAVSAGLGLADVNGLWSTRRHFTHPNWMINYGVVMDTMVGSRRFFHALSLVFRL